MRKNLSISALFSSLGDVLLFLLFCLFSFKNIVTINLVCGEDFWLNGIVTISFGPYCVVALISKTDGKRFVAASAARAATQCLCCFEFMILSKQSQRQFPITLITQLIIDRKLCMFFEMLRICVTCGKISNVLIFV